MGISDGRFTGGGGGEMRVVLKEEVFLNTVYNLQCLSTILYVINTQEVSSP